LVFIEFTASNETSSRNQSWPHPLPDYEMADNIPFNLFVRSRAGLALYSKL